MWVAVGGTPESVLRAGNLGLPVMFAIIGGNPAQFKPLFDYYKKVYNLAGHSENKMQVLIPKTNTILEEEKMAI